MSETAPQVGTAFTFDYFQCDTLVEAQVSEMRACGERYGWGRLLRVDGVDLAITAPQPPAPAWYVAGQAAVVGGM